MLISSILKNWYLQNKRDLPWRQTRNPYYIWISEVILQQTRVNQGLSYYFKFIEQFSDIKTLAHAKAEDVYKVWQGLGYYSRARNLHEGAMFVHQNYQGSLPGSYDELLTIKGIGEYTAAAIASIAFNLPYAAIDGNVHRVITRIYGITDAVNTAEGRKKIRKSADELLDHENPGQFNQAIMEFGALQCVPKSPNCNLCPVASFCYALQHNMVQQLPFKIKNSKITTRFFTYIYIEHNGCTFIKKRDKKDIWQGLYELPLIETKSKYSFEELLHTKEWLAFFKNVNVYIIGNGKRYKHQLTHQTIEVEFIHIKMDVLWPELGKHYVMIKKEELTLYPVSRLIEKYLQDTEL
jgi:A/G-specific adenine glycosylase